MNKCFITKLPSSVDNDNLPVLGQLRINWLKQDGSPDAGQRCVAIKTNDKVTVKVSGAHFTDETLTSNLGNTKTITAADGTVRLYVSNDSDAVLTIDNKYSLTELGFIQNDWDSTSKPIYLNLEDIKYCTNLNGLGIATIQLSGDINSLSNLTKLTVLYLHNTNISGDISALSNLTKLAALYLNNTQISGDISALSNLTNLTWININNTQISGDISALSNLTNMISMFLSNTQVGGDINSLSNLTKLEAIDCFNTNITGDVSKLSNLTTLAAKTNWMWTKGISLTGDMSKVPSNVFFISQITRKINTNFTWTANGRQNATLLAMDGQVPFDTASMDNMLIDQATCTLASSATSSYLKVIAVRGTRTAASDAAVAAIQNMGVTITGVTKQA